MSRQKRKQHDREPQQRARAESPKMQSEEGQSPQVSTERMFTPPFASSAPAQTVFFRARSSRPPIPPGRCRGVEEQAGALVSAIRSEAEVIA